MEVADVQGAGRALRMREAARRARRLTAWKTARPTPERAAGEPDGGDVWDETENTRRSYRDAA